MMKAAALFAVGALALTSGPTSAAEGEFAAHRFDEMKRLVGTWRRADNPSSPLRIRFFLTAGGTVLVEQWQRGDQAHSLTVYHRDADTIIATHYCPQGNQPRLALLPPSTEKVVRFSFRDATDLESVRESHLTSLTFDLSDEAVLVRRERYRQAGLDEDSELRLVREP
jgi:hypothetical protein